MCKLLTLSVAFIGFTFAACGSSSEPADAIPLVVVDETQQNGKVTDPAVDPIDPGSFWEPQVPHAHEPAKFSSCNLSEGDKVQTLWQSMSNPGFQPVMGHRYANLAFAPIPGLLLQSGGGDMGPVFRYTETGTEAFPAPAMGRFSVDNQWQVRLQMVAKKAELRWLVTDELFFEAEPTPSPYPNESNYPRFQAALTEGAARLVTLTCYAGHALVTSYELPKGTQGPVASFQNFHCNFGPQGMLLVPTPNEEGVLISATHGGVMQHVNLLTGAVTQAQVADKEVQQAQETQVFWHHIVFDAVVHPNNEWAATTSTDGRMRFWSLPGLKEIRTPIQVGIEAGNQNTYMPFNVSAMGISPDGKLLAHVTPEFDVVLRNTDTFEIHATLERPEIPKSKDDNFSSLIQNSALRFAFEKDSNAVGVLYLAGPALYGCQDWKIEGEAGHLDVLLDGPETAKVKEEVTFVATHIGTTHVHGHQFFVNNVPLSSMSMGREFTWKPLRKGTYEITVVIDDGFQVGEASRTMTVE